MWSLIISYWKFVQPRLGAVAPAAGTSIRKSMLFILVPPARIELTLAAPQAAVLSIERRGRDKSISESEPGRHQVNDGMVVYIFVNVLKEVGVHEIRVHTLKRDDEMR